MNPYLFAVLLLYLYKMIENNKKIYFIITTEKSFDPYITYASKTDGFTNYKRVFSKTIIFTDKEYIISINSYDLNENVIKKSVEDNKYKLLFNMNYNYFFNSTYEAEILFLEKRNTFIFDFKIKEDNSIFLSKAVNILKISFKDKLMLYEKFLDEKKSEQGDPLSNALIDDSIEYVMDNEKIKRYNLEDYLELLVFCYKTNKIKTLLQKFNLKKCDLTNCLNPEKYSKILEEMELNHEIYTKYCFKNEDENECKKQFYTLLLSFRKYYEKDKVKSQIHKKELIKVYAEIINENEKLYDLVNEANEELIELIMNQKKLSFGIIKKIIFLFNPEKILAFLNKYEKIIFEEVINNNLYYNIIDLRHSVDFTNIKEVKEPEKSPIFDRIKELNIKKRKYNFILFNDAFYNDYFNNDEVKIFLINKSIYICLKFDKKYEQFKNQKLKEIENSNNIQLLEYLEKDLSLYEKSEYEIYYYNYEPKNDVDDSSISKFFIRKIKTKKYCRYIYEFVTTYKPLDIFNRFESKTMDEKFYKKWNSIKEKVFKLNKKIQRYDLDQFIIINNIDDMKDFENIFKLLFIDDNEYIKNNFYSYLKRTITLLKDKFLSIVTNKTLNKTYLHLIYDIIKGLDKYELNSTVFLEDIEKKLSNKEIIYQIYIYLSSYYFPPSNSIYLNESEQLMINHMSNYIIKNNLINVVNYLNNIKEKITKIILKIIDSKICEDMLYNGVKDIYYFELLKTIRKEGLVQNSSIYEKEIKNINLILSKIKNGDVKCELINSIFADYIKKSTFINKLSILVFNNENKHKEYLDYIQNFLYQINYELNYFKEFEELSYKYFYSIYSRNYSLVDKIKNNIKNGKLNEIYNNSKTDLKKIHLLIPHLHKKYIIKDSLIFTDKYKKGEKKIDVIFDEVMTIFNELKILFEEKWESKINKSMLDQLYNLAKPENRKKDFKSELNILIKYHEIKGMKEESVEKICCEIICYYENEKIIALMDQIKLEMEKENSLTYKNYIKNYLQKGKDLFSSLKRRDFEPIKKIFNEDEEKKEGEKKELEKRDSSSEENETTDGNNINRNIKKKIIYKIVRNERLKI